MKKTQQISYETAFDELRGILADLQNGNVSLDDLALKVARAQELLDLCRQKLRSTEAAIQQLNAKAPVAP